MLLTIDYSYLKKWKPIVLTTLIVELVYQSIIYFHPENIGWLRSGQFSWLHTLEYVFVDQILIECISVAILFQVIRIYGTTLRLFEVHLSPKELVKYELKFLPAILVAFFFFAPFTLTARFLYHYLPDLNWDDYFAMYFYSTELYLIYLAPVFFVGYVILNVNLIRTYNEQLSETGVQLSREKHQKMRTRLWAMDDFGEVFLDINKIQWIERKDRKTFATVEAETYRLKENLTQLEEKLSPDQFVRISRSVIVNLSEVANYSFWENDKYILRMRASGVEFVMSRDRLNKIKDLLLAEMSK